MGFVGAGKAAVVPEPAEGPLDDPASRDDLEVLVGGSTAVTSTLVPRRSPWSMVLVR